MEVIRDIRHFVFPLFLAANPDLLPPQAPIEPELNGYLGTAFMVTKNGIALSAAHCLPPPESIPTDKAVLAALMIDGLPKWHRVLANAVPTNTDLAILKISTGITPFLQVSFDRLVMGDNVEAAGIPSHAENYRGEVDFRCLKGYLVSGTHPSRLAELSFEIPRGMSGSPLFKDDKVVGVLLGNERSEFPTDGSEEEVEIVDGVTRVTKVEIRRVIRYGAAEHLWRLRDWHHELTSGEALPAFIDRMNKLPAPRV